MAGFVATIATTLSVKLALIAARVRLIAVDRATA
jgi:hypothetical protein